MIRVAVAGANGRMGSLAVDAVKNADDLTFAGGFARGGDFIEFLREHSPDVLIDFTTHPATVEIATACIEHGVAPVIGATGWTENEKHRLAALAKERGASAMLVPNFAIGAVLMMRFAEEAAAFFSSVEIVELHHDQKRDKPSGTAKLTAERISAVTGTAVPIHSVRLRGLIAHQEVLLGSTGEVLTIRHDSLSRDSFVPGILFAVRAVRQQAGLTIGLDSLLGSKPQ
jgi:4-hydroxy-tetrahydrodipicolinate reductase